MNSHLSLAIMVLFGLSFTSLMGCYGFGETSSDPESNPTDSETPSISPNDSDTPTEGSDTPTEGSDTPTEGSDTSTEDSDTPTEDSDTCPPHDAPVCGDSCLGDGEDCDYGDTEPKDGCDESCQFEDCGRGRPNKNCKNGVADDPPLNFQREGYSGQGPANVVVRYSRQEGEQEAEYIYVAAGYVLQVHKILRACADCEPLTPAPLPIPLPDAAEFRDEIQHMDVDGNFLFLDAGGDGFHILELSENPIKPKAVYSGPLPDSDCVINDLDANHLLVAFACYNFKTSDQNIDAKVYRFTPPKSGQQEGTLTSENDILSSEARTNVLFSTIYPISIALTENNSGLYLGYYHHNLVQKGAITYASLGNTPEEPPVFKRWFHVGAPWDMAVQGNHLYAAIEIWDFPAVLSRFKIDEETGEMIMETLLNTLHPNLKNNNNKVIGKSLHIHKNLLVFAVEGVGRHPFYDVKQAKTHSEQSNVWLFKWDDELTALPNLVASGSTFHEVLDISCRYADTASKWAYVAEGWGGLQLWRLNEENKSLELPSPPPAHDYHIPTGHVATKVWVEDGKVYSAKRGAGLWQFDETSPEGEIPSVEWLDGTEPGCDCEGCSCPTDSDGRYPPSVFTWNGDTKDGRMALLNIPRNDHFESIGGMYFQVFDYDKILEQYTCSYSNLLEDPANTHFEGGNVRWVDDHIFSASLNHGLQIYEAAGSPQSMTLRAELPSQDANRTTVFADAVAHEKYLYVAETVHENNQPIDGRIAVYEWKYEDVTEGEKIHPNPIFQFDFRDNLEQLSSYPQRLALFFPDGEEKLPHLLVVFQFPSEEHRLFEYDLNLSVADMEARRMDLTPRLPDRAEIPKVKDVLVHENSLYIVDETSGLYRVPLDSRHTVKVTAFYPAHQGGSIKSPDGVYPLAKPVSIDISAPGKIYVQESESGRVVILSETTTQ